MFFLVQITISACLLWCKYPVNKIIIPGGIISRDIHTLADPECIKRDGKTPVDQIGADLSQPLPQVKNGYGMLGQAVRFPDHADIVFKKEKK